MNLATELNQDVFAGGGEMGELMRSIEWSRTPLGPADTRALRTMVRILLANRFPLLLWWGPQHCQLYNDAYRPVLGTKHPTSMGQPASECWPEIWDVIGPLLLTPYNGGPATWDDDIFLEVNRHGFMEETHFTIAYSPVPDEEAPTGIGGVLATVHEITQQVIQGRRTAILSDLGARASEAKTAEEACSIAAETMERHAKDIPFALLYLLDEEQRTATLAGTAGVRAGAPVSPVSVDAGIERRSGWPFARALRSEEPQIVDELAQRFTTVPPGPWSDRPKQAMLLPIPSNIQHRLAGFLVLGISPRLELDVFYRSFCNLVTAHVATVIANARAYEEERRRAEALAEIDRAKTAFFSNVSHEFRTPLTLLLGPIEDALAAADGRPEQQERLAVAQRNALRLLRLVNTLLDFSRIEAGRLQASYEPVDLAAYTAELASNFRSAIERAGLTLTVECRPLPAGVVAYVDRDMWEKIVLNLVSNAFKFTLEGEIRVSLQTVASDLVLEVADTGSGIAAEELPRLFERFHRVQGAQARTHEGTGIGLALVLELVRLHGGQIQVASTPGAGTTFTVLIPSGAAHLPQDRVTGPTQTTTSLGALPYVEEALRWLPDDAPEPPFEASEPRSQEGRGAVEGRVLLADDNRDMREYVARLLGARFLVEAVADGQAALEAAVDNPPDLVLSDIMMPRMDGIALANALRADPRTREVPIILLSARAGEEARVEGLRTGADDYLTKPFSAQELLARVETHLQLSRVRKEALAREQAARADAEQARSAAERNGTELTRLLEQIAGLEREKEQFLEAAAHDLKTPLTAIHGFVQLLQRQRSPDPTKVQSMLAQIATAAQKATGLVDELLEMARAGATDALELHLQPTDLVDMCQRVIGGQQTSDHVQLRLETALPALTGTWDAERLERAIENLVSNALKYSPDGGSVVVRLREQHDGAGRAALIEVEDHGIGIPRADLERIFQRFERGTNVNGRVTGNGIGLTYVREVVHRHQGTIRVDSEEGQGSTFTVRLPLG